VNICKISRFIVVGLLLLFTFQAMAAIQVVIRDSGGSEELIDLYSNYHALVIGAGDYQTGWRDLPNAVSDAREVSALLKDLGWNVDLLENPDGKTLNLKLNDLIVSTASDQEKAVLVWFSGHGHTEGRADGSPFGYLVPVDSPDPYSDRAGFLGTAISMDRIKSVSTQLRAKHVLMMFDSCFSGTLFSATRAMSPSPYIKRKVEGQVRQYITAGQAEETVPDRSVFKQSFIDGVQDGEADFNQDGYITGTELGSYLTEKVANYTNGAQNPLFGKIQNPYLNRGDFVFLNPAYDDEVSQNPQAKPREVDRRVLDLTFWQEIKSSSDPALYEEYLNQFPQGVFSGLATIRMAKLHAPKDSGHSAGSEKKTQETRQGDRDEIEAASAFRALAWAIQDQVSSNWNEAGDFSGLSVSFLVKVDRDGNVISSTITKKSGDARLDKSAENAIFKASPLPFPTEPHYYEYLKEFNFVFKP
jgi:TonB family protein